MRKTVLFLALLLCSWKVDESNKEWVLSIHAEGGSLTRYGLDLKGVSPLVSAVSSTPDVREVRSIPLSTVVQNWDRVFKGSAPNAVITFMSKDGKMPEHVLVLKKPEERQGQLFFHIEQQSSSFEGSFDDAVLFIDMGIMCCLDSTKEF